MKNISKLNLDDLMCLYHCLELELQRITLSCMPDSMRNYWNQLNKLQSLIHSLILKEEDKLSAKCKK